MNRTTTAIWLVAGLSAIGLICWLVMFLAGTDVWHFAGSPDFWRLNGSPNTDLRAFGIAFYLLLAMLITMLGCSVWMAMSNRRIRNQR